MITIKKNLSGQTERLDEILVYFNDRFSKQTDSLIDRLFMIHFTLEQINDI